MTNTNKAIEKMSVQAKKVNKAIQQIKEAKELINKMKDEFSKAERMIDNSDLENNDELLREYNELMKMVKYIDTYKL